MIQNEFFKKLSETHPFITVCSYANQDYVGIVQNRDDVVTTIYDYGALKTIEQKNQFLLMAETWWWESNRLVPINVFLREDWSPFKPVLKTMNSKDVQIKFGPYVSLKEISAKRSKRRSITLIRKVG